MSADAPSVLPLHCEIQHYAWGQAGSISALIGATPTGEPEAELWMGAHPKAPSLLDGGQTLLDAISASPATLLGERVDHDFGQLPFLFKVLAAEIPLSIQAHPSLERAKAGFVDENEKGIAIDAPDRTYRDPNHKPELICALTPFEAKCGFRSLAGTRALFDALDHPHLDPVRKILGEDPHPNENDTLRRVLAFLLGRPPVEATQMADAVAARAAELVTERHEICKQFGPDLEACARVAAAFPGDIGGVVALLLNHVVLAPGEALYLGSGNLHAYLHGVGIELMANSDNVLRGGLTPKHIDIDELLAVVEYQPIDVPIQRPTGAVHTYESPVPEFALTRIELSATPVDIEGPAIVLITTGEGQLGRATISAGHPHFVSASCGSLSLSGKGLAWAAGVGASLAPVL